MLKLRTLALMLALSAQLLVVSVLSAEEILDAREWRVPQKSSQYLSENDELREVLLTMGDIHASYTTVSMRSGGTRVLARQVLNVGDSLPFTWRGVNYRLHLDAIDYELIGMDYAHIRIERISSAKAPDTQEV
jgi:hypothetical protein